MKENNSKTIKYKRKKRKSKAKKFFLLLFVLAIAAGFVYCVTFAFPIKKISVKGESIYSQEAIITASGIDIDDNIFLLGSNAKKRITEKLPYIKDVKFIRTFPDKITLKVMPDNAKKCYLCNDKYYLSDENNKILEKTDACPNGIFLVKADFGKNIKPGKKINFKEKNQKSTLDAVMAEFKKNKISIDSVDVSVLTDIKVKVDGRLIVYIGSSNSLENKVAHLKAMLGKIDNTTTGTINLKSWSKEKPEGYLTRKSIENIDNSATESVKNEN